MQDEATQPTRKLTQEEEIAEAASNAIKTVYNAINEKDLEVLETIKKEFAGDDTQYDDRGQILWLCGLASRLLGENDKLKTKVNFLTREYLLTQLGRVNFGRASP